MVSYKVQKVFQLQDRLVLVSDALGGLSGLKHGGTIKLKRPDGSIISTKTWLETSWPAVEDRPVSFSIESNFQKADVPEGTEILLGEELGEEVEKEKRRHTA